MLMGTVIVLDTSMIIATIAHNAHNALESIFQIITTSIAYWSRCLRHYSMGEISGLISNS